MAHQRLSTVFDYSDLRLHPDGLRVHQNATKNLRPGLLKTNVQTSRENWIARDAGGSGVVPRFRPRKKKKAQDEDQDENQAEGGSGDEEGDDEKRAGADRKGKGKAVEDASADEDSSNEPEATGKRKRRKGTNKYKLKRLKFAADLDYLAPSLSRASSSTPASAPIAGSSRAYDDSVRAGSSSQGAGAQVARISLPEPSADLLKAIHRYASEFYSERGQLLNISRQYRAARKQRAALRKEKRLQREKRDAAKALADVNRWRLRSESASRSASHSRSRSASAAAVSGESGESDEDEDMDMDMDGSSSSSGSDSEKTDAKTKGDDAENGKHDIEGEEGVENDDNNTQSHPKYKSTSKGKQKATDTDATKAKDQKEESKPKRTKQPGDGKVYTDMYKVFDGSAMLALAMLVQEHIAHLLTPRVPPGWEDEMREWYTQNEYEAEDIQDAASEGLVGADEDELADENMEEDDEPNEDAVDKDEDEDNDDGTPSVGDLDGNENDSEKDGDQIEVTKKTKKRVRKKESATTKTKAKARRKRWTPMKRSRRK